MDVQIIAILNVGRNTGFHRRKFLAIEVKVYADVKHDEVSWYCNNEGDSKPISQQYGKGSDQKKHNINFGAPHHTAFKFIHENTTLLIFRRKHMQNLTEEEKEFLRLVHTNREVLLERLEKLGLLEAFLQAENGTT